MQICDSFINGELERLVSCTAATNRIARAPNANSGVRGNERQKETGERGNQGKINERKNGRMNERTKEWKDERVNEKTKERTEEWANGRTKK